MRRFALYGLVPALSLIVACADPAPVGPRLPAGAALASNCSLGMSDADAQATLDAMTAAVNALQTDGSLNAGQANALRKHIENIRASIAGGNYCAAAAQLKAFSEQVRNFVAEGILTEEEAEPLTGGAIDVLEGVYTLSFNSDRDGNSEIYSAKSNGTNLVNHTSNGASEFYFSWSPDGSKLAFVSNRDGNDDVYVINRNGTGLARLTTPGAGVTFVRWSPDGARIAFVRVGPLPELWVMMANGADQKRIAYGEWPQWAPDGTQLTYSSFRNSDHDVFAINVDGTNERQLSFALGTDSYPLWSPDGSLVVWRSDRHATAEIYANTPDGANERRLTNNSVFDHPSGFSPDGKILTSNRCGNTCQVYAIRMDGSGETNLTNDPAVRAFDSHFSADGKRIVYVQAWVTTPRERRDVYVMNADGSNRRKITKSDADHLDPVFLP